MGVTSHALPLFSGLEGSNCSQVRSVIGTRYHEGREEVGQFSEICEMRNAYVQSVFVHLFFSTSVAVFCFFHMPLGIQ